MVDLYLQALLHKSEEPSPINEQIVHAIRFLISDGAQYLDHQQDEEMVAQLKKMGETLETLDGNLEIPDNLQTFFHLDESFMQAVFKIAIAKFKEEEYEVSQDCFIFLSSLNPLQFDYCYRVGIVAQKRGEYEQAIEAYQAALLIDPNHVGAKLFSAECYLELGQFEEAERLWEEAKLEDTSEWALLEQRIRKGKGAFPE